MSKPKELGGLGVLDLRNLGERCDGVGCGRTRQIPPNLGLVWTCLINQRIDSSSMPQPSSRSGTVRKHISGIIVGWTVKLPKTLRHTSLNLLRGKTQRSSKSSTITVGFACSEPQRQDHNSHSEEFISLWLRVQSIQLQPGIRDSVVWKWSTDGIYSTQSTYRIQFQGS